MTPPKKNNTILYFFGYLVLCVLGLIAYFAWGPSDTSGPPEGGCSITEYKMGNC